MCKIIFVLVITFLFRCGVDGTYSVTPKLISNDCSYAVQQHPTTVVEVVGDLNEFGWHDLKRVDEDRFGRHFVARHTLHTTPSGMELMILESVTFNGKTCDSIYLGELH